MTNAFDTDDVIKRANALSSAGQIDQALNLVRSAIKEQPRQGKLWHMLGIVHRMDQDSAA